MKKNKTILIHPDLGARIIVSHETIEAPEGWTALANPSTKFVDAHPPELWKLVDGVLMPITEEKEMARRLERVAVGPRLQDAARAHDMNLGEALATIRKINDIPALFDVLDERVSALIGRALIQSDFFYEQQMNAVQKTKKLLFVIIFLLAILLVKGFV